MAMKTEAPKSPPLSYRSLDPSLGVCAPPDVEGISFKKMSGGGGGMYAWSSAIYGSTTGDVHRMLTLLKACVPKASTSHAH